MDQDCDLTAEEQKLYDFLTSTEIKDEDAVFTVVKSLFPEESEQNIYELMSKAAKKSMCEHVRACERQERHQAMQKRREEMREWVDTAMENLDLFIPLFQKIGRAVQEKQDS